MSTGVSISCEHACADVPPNLIDCFLGHDKVLATHRAYDPGALETARLLAGALRIKTIHEGKFTRLLIDLNRSTHHRRVWSEFSPPPGDPRRTELLKAYRDYREKVERDAVKTLSLHDRVIHFGVHTFTPVWNGEPRPVDIGLLYDPARTREKALCHRIRDALRARYPRLRLRLNQPYQGKADGLTTTLRRTLGPRYLGIELELNHGPFFDDSPRWLTLRDSLIQALRDTLN